MTAQCGADPELTNKKGVSALSVACDAEAVPVVSLMLEADKSADHSLALSLGHKAWERFGGEVGTVLMEHEKKHKDIKALALMRNFLDKRQ